MTKYYEVCAAIASHKSEIIISCLNVDCNFLSTDYEDLRQTIINQINAGLSEMISFYDMI